MKSKTNQPPHLEIAADTSPAAWTPKRVKHELDRYIVGQESAKRAVAVAIRNRWRRQQLDAEIRDEVLPKNILMIGPTGVGKTEIARRVSKMLMAPFVKVEASTFTEVGYVGRDVDSMIRDLVETSVSQLHQERLQAVQQDAESSANQRLAEILVDQQERDQDTQESGTEESSAVEQEDPALRRKREANARRRYTRRRNRLLAKISSHEIDDEIIELEYEIEIEATHPHMGIFSAGSEEELHEALNDLVDGFTTRKRSRQVKIREARTILTQQEAHKMIDYDAIVEAAIERAEQTGIVFIDEIDKTISHGSEYGPDVSGEGVQRDLLPIVEGAVVGTRYGPVKTDHMLFITAGAFHGVQPSDLIPELQGRFPVRVELASLSENDLYAILVEPENALTRQYTELLATENIELKFTEDGLREIASFAALVNSRTEDIGARRLHTLVERVLEDLSFEASEREGETVSVDKAFVRERVGDIVLDEDFSKFIL